MSKESFKIFAKLHPELVSHIKSGNMTWQKFYEIYDIYGDDNKAWEPYINNKTNINGISNILSGIDSDSIQKHINTAQKAIGVVQELIGKGKTTSLNNIASGPLKERPINKFFED